MEFWMHKVGVSKEAAKQQIDIITRFSPEKRMRIALDFANMGIAQTRSWITEQNPHLSEPEVNLEFVRLMYYESGQMNEENWLHFKHGMQKRSKQDWSKRFRNMMKEQKLTYDDVAHLGGFKNGQVVKATISRGLPSFARLAVVLHERQMQSDAEEEPH